MVNSKRPLRPLNAQDIRNIRRLKGKLSQSELSRIYDRSQPQISMIQNKVTFRWVGDDEENDQPNKKVDVNDWFNRHLHNRKE